MTRAEWDAYCLVLTGRYPLDADRFTDTAATTYFTALSRFDAGVVADALQLVTEREKRLPTCHAVLEQCQTLARAAAIRHALPEPKDHISWREWILSGTGEYLDGQGEKITPSGAVAIWQRAGYRPKFTTDQLAAADRVAA